MLSVGDFSNGSASMPNNREVRFRWEDHGKIRRLLKVEHRRRGPGEVPQKMALLDWGSEWSVDEDVAEEHDYYTTFEDVTVLGPLKNPDVVKGLEIDPTTTEWVFKDGPGDTYVLMYKELLRRFPDELRTYYETTMFSELDMDTMNDGTIVDEDWEDAPITKKCRRSRRKKRVEENENTENAEVVKKNEEVVKAQKRNNVEVESDGEGMDKKKEKISRKRRRGRGRDSAEVDKNTENEDETESMEVVERDEVVKAKKKPDEIEKKKNPQGNGGKKKKVVVDNNNERDVVDKKKEEISRKRRRDRGRDSAEVNKNTEDEDETESMEVVERDEAVEKEKKKQDDVENTRNPHEEKKGELKGILKKKNVAVEKEKEHESVQKKRGPTIQIQKNVRVREDSLELMREKGMKMMNARGDDDEKKNVIKMREEKNNEDKENVDPNQRDSPRRTERVSSPPSSLRDYVLVSREKSDKTEKDKKEVVKMSDDKNKKKEKIDPNQTDGPRRTERVSSPPSALRDYVLVSREKIDKTEKDKKEDVVKMSEEKNKEDKENIDPNKRDALRRTERVVSPPSSLRDYVLVSPDKFHKMEKDKKKEVIKMTEEKNKEDKEIIDPNKRDGPRRTERVISPPSSLRDYVLVSPDKYHKME